MGRRQRPSTRNLVLVAIWDQRSQENSASDEYGRFIVPKGADQRHVIKGNTWQELADNIGKRLKKYASETGGIRLAPDFVKTLRTDRRPLQWLRPPGQG